MKLSNTDALIKFLKEKSNKKDDILKTIIEFLHTEQVLELVDRFKSKITAPINFHDYFDSVDSVNELINMKDSDPHTYYTVIYYETIFINIICKALDMPYTIVLAPEDLESSYFLVIKCK